MIPILILAAGSSSRMRGCDKLLEKIAGKPLLRHLAEIALSTGQPVFVTLPPGAVSRRAAVSGLPLHLIEVADAAEGMGASLRHGVSALPAAASNVLVLLADLPGITAQDLQLMLTGAASDPWHIHRATSATGIPGHPVVFPSRLFLALKALTGDEGARDVLKSHQSGIRLTALPGTHATTDLDTPEAWTDWRAETGL